MYIIQCIIWVTVHLQYALWATTEPFWIKELTWLNHAPWFESGFIFNQKIHLPQWTARQTLSALKSFELEQNVSEWLTQITFNWIFLSGNHIFKVTLIRSETIKKSLFLWHVFHHSTWKWTISLRKEKTNWAACSMFAKYLLHINGSSRNSKVWFAKSADLTTRSQRETPESKRAIQPAVPARMEWSFTKHIYVQIKRYY